MIFINIFDFLCFIIINRLILILFNLLYILCNRYHWYRQPTKGIPHFFYFQEPFIFTLLFQFSQIPDQLRIPILLTIGKLHNIIIILTNILKPQPILFTPYILIFIIIINHPHYHRFTFLILNHLTTLNPFYIFILILF